MQTVETAKKYLGSVVCAVDIAGAEGLFPTEMFVPVFAKVREYGLPMTIHAGEAAGPDSMRTALSYGTKRIGHGVAAIHHGIDGLAQRSGGFAWAVSLLGDAVVGVVTGFVVLLVVTLVQKVWKGARKAG